MLRKGTSVPWVPSSSFHSEYKVYFCRYKLVRVSLSLLTLLIYIINDGQIYGSEKTWFGTWLYVHSSQQSYLVL